MVATAKASADSLGDIRNAYALLIQAEEMLKSANELLVLSPLGVAVGLLEERYELATPEEVLQRLEHLRS